MREELSRSNSIGDLHGIDMILRIIFDEKVINIKAIDYMCGYQSLMNLNCYLALVLFEDINLIELAEENIVFTHYGNELCKLTIAQRKNRISEIIMEHLVSEKLINYNSITIDSVSGELRIPVNAFLLSAAVYRNFLHSIGSIVKDGCYFLVKDPNLRAKFESQIVQEKRKISQSDLIKIMQKQQEDGDRGELYVVEYENKRLGNKKLSPKRISPIDVGAGYDILSCQDSFSTEYDRYIEVKSFRGMPHFYWSANEKRVAEALGEKYYIYLIDLNALEDNPVGYFPHIICNPTEELFKDGWLVETDSYRITYLND